MQKTINGPVMYEENFWICRPKEMYTSTFNPLEETDSDKQGEFNWCIAKAEHELSKINWIHAYEHVAMEFA